MKSIAPTGPLDRFRGNKAPEAKAVSEARGFAWRLLPRLCLPSASAHQLSRERRFDLAEAKALSEARGFACHLHPRISYRESGDLIWRKQRL